MKTAEERPLVSVITVVFNGAQTIAATIESVLAQESRAFEYLIIDGASTDGTLRVLEEYRDRIDTLISERDRGIYDAMNKGLRLARGQWVHFLNCGDRFAHPSVLRELEDSLRDARHDVIAGHFILCWTDLEMSFAPKQLAIGSMPSCHQALFVRAEHAKRLQFDTTLRVGADYDMITRTLHEDASRLLLSKTVVAKVQVEGFSANNRFTAIKDYRRIVARHFGVFRAALWWTSTVARIAVSSAVKALASERVMRSLRRALYGRK